MEMKENKVVVAITGASGQIYAEKLLASLAALDKPPKETAVIISDTARKVWEYEIGRKFEVPAMAKGFENDDFFAPFASGSSSWNIMIICPASMGTVGRIAAGTSDDLICRAADVMLKERRKLIIVPRETPYSLIHLENMKNLSCAGAIICPATPSFYRKTIKIDELVMTVVERIISLAGFEGDSYRWMEND